MNTATTLCILLFLALGLCEKQFFIVHTTDIHGWVAGHPHSPTLNADFGDFVALFQHLKENNLKSGIDFLAYDSGDLTEGTGLSDATEIHGEYIYNLMKRVPFYTGLTMGNHDIGHSNAVEYSKKTFIPHYNDVPTDLNGKYLTSNSHFINGDFIGKPYYVKQTELGTRILVMGFMFNFTQEAPTTKFKDVFPVSTALLGAWFYEAMAEENIDLITATMHIDPQTPPEMEQIHKAIRIFHPDLPIVFFTGHRHRLFFKKLDDNSYAIESGKYFNHLGLLTFQLDNGFIENLNFSWPETTRDNFYALANRSASDFLTPEAKETKLMIEYYQKKLNLTFVYGCSPNTFRVDAPFEDTQTSLYNLYIEQIIPTVVFNKSLSNRQFFLSNTGTLRSDLYEGPVNVNDIFSVNPFSDMYFFYTMNGSQLAEFLPLAQENVAMRSPELITRLKAKHPGLCNDEDIEKRIQAAGMPHYLYSTSMIIPTATYDLVMADYDAEALEPVVQAVLDPTGKKQIQPSLYPTDVNSSTALSVYVTEFWPCSS